MELLRYIGEFDETKIDKQEILKFIEKHKTTDHLRIKRNNEYYLGNHQILRREKRTGVNNKVISNHAKDIADTSSSYFMSSPITYSTHDETMIEQLDRLTDYLDMANIDETDHDNALDMSRAGVAYEYVYAKQGESRPQIKNLEPMNTFIVYDDSIEENPLFGVYYYVIKSPTSKEYYKAIVATENYIWDLIIYPNQKNQSTNEEPIPHYFSGVPIVEYRNGKDGLGDFELQISLIDAYNTLMSDRINDKEQFLESILVLYGSMLGDDEEETSKAIKALKDSGFMEMPKDARAEYITRQFDENGCEVLKKAIKDDIYSLSHVPCLTDENFVGNSSGVAMEYKLFGLEMITRTKERYYIKGLKKRMTLLSNYLGLKNIVINPSAIIPEFKRGLPKNMLELSQMITNLKGTVSQKTLISQLDFVEDVDGELNAVQEENAQKVLTQQALFGGYPSNETKDEVNE